MIQLLNFYGNSSVEFCITLYVVFFLTYFIESARIVGRAASLVNNMNYYTGCVLCCHSPVHNEYHSQCRPTSNIKIGNSRVDIPKYSCDY